MTTGIYKILSPTGKVYIGQSWHIERRWVEHSGGWSKTYVSRSIKKHGADNHRFFLIHELPNDVSQSVLNIYEQLYMDLYKNCNVKLLNSKDAGSYGLINDEARLKISLALKGRKHSDEHRRKNSLAKKGKKMSDEQKDKRRKYWTGKTHTEATKLKMSNSMRGLKRSDETKAKISAIAKGRIISDETKIKLSVAGTGRKHSEETRKKLSEKTTAYHLKRRINDPQSGPFTNKTNSPLS